MMKRKWRKGIGTILPSSLSSSWVGGALYLTTLSIYSSGSSRDAHWECVCLVCGIAVGCVLYFQDS